MKNIMIELKLNLICLRKYQLLEKIIIKKKELKSKWSCRQMLFKKAPRQRVCFPLEEFLNFLIN